MKTRLIVLLLGLSSIVTYAQKDELKAAEKAIKKQDYTAAVSAITSAESMISSMDVKSKAKFYFLKGKAYMGKKEFQTAVDAFNTLEDVEKKSGRSKYTASASL